MQPTQRVLTTKGSQAPFEFWHDVVCQRFTALETKPSDARRFQGAIRAERQIGGSSLSTIAASPQVVSRTKEGISRRPCGALFVNIQISGTCAVQTHDSETLLGPGDLAVLDADHPFEMRFDRDFRQACIHLGPRDVPVDAALSGTILRGKDVAGRNMHSLIHHIAENDDAKGALEAAIALLETSAACAARYEIAHQHLSLIKQYITRNSDDPDLTPDTLAHHFRISKRHVHKLFAQSGETFMQYLLYKRLCRARERMIAAPQIRLGTVAKQSGFQTASHFSRSFSKAFGSAPKAWRAKLN